MSELNITSQVVTSQLGTMKIDGVVDVSTFSRLEEGIRQVLELPPARILLDLSGLAATSSAGLGVLVELSRQLAGRKGKLVLAAPAPEVRGLLELLGLDGFFTLSATLEEGRKELSKVK